MRRPLRVGTDCSGIEAPIVALRQLRIPFTHEFSSEIDPHCIATIRGNFSPKIIFGDITSRDVRDVPDIDLYVCGFPCQPFSTAGRRLGERDPRGTVFYECLRVIRHKKPLVFILENVRGLVSIDGGETFRTILDSLHRLKIYDVHWKVLNTADYGIPQSRKRVFIVGIRRDRQKKPFEWPEPIACRSLEEFVDWEDKTRDGITDRMKKIIRKLPPASKFINLSFARDSNRNTNRLCPTITTAGNIWCVPLQRYASVSELLALQGFPIDFRFAGKYHKKMIGNTMSVNVICAVFRSIFQNVA